MILDTFTSPETIKATFAEFACALLVELEHLNDILADENHSDVYDFLKIKKCYDSLNSYYRSHITVLQEVAFSVDVVGRKLLKYPNSLDYSETNIQNQILFDLNGYVIIEVKELVFAVIKIE